MAPLGLKVKTDKLGHFSLKVPTGTPETVTVSKKGFGTYIRYNVVATPKAEVKFSVALSKTPSSGREGSSPKPAPRLKPADAYGVTIVKATSGPSCTGFYSDTSPPSTIRVLVYANHDSNGEGVGAPSGIQTIAFSTYLKGVVPNEWESSWLAESLKSGAMAAKTYGWYWVNHFGGTYNGGCFDVTDDTYFQRYDGSLTAASTDSAVDATFSSVMTEGGHIFQAAYLASIDASDPSNFDTCGEFTTSQQQELSQTGSQSCAQAGDTYQAILALYYKGNSVSPGTVTPPPPSGNGVAWKLRNTNSGGAANYSFGYGPTGAIPIYGDWDGNGSTTAGVIVGNSSDDGEKWYLTNTNGSSSPSYSFGWGNKTCFQLAGDWNGDGHDTPGVACKDTSTSPAQWRWSELNHLGAGAADAQFDYGNASCSPVVGDWDGNGTTTIGVACDSGSGMTWGLRNANSSGGANISFGFGNSTCTPITGDWDGNGTTTVGNACSNSGWQWYLNNNNAGGSPSYPVFGSGASNYAPITGDWDGNGTTTIGVVLGGVNPQLVAGGMRTVVPRSEMVPNLPSKRKLGQW